MINLLENNKIVLIAGHRGYKSSYPENTLLSFKEALGLKVDMLEIDLNLTKDKEIVVIHDTTVDRTTNGKGNVRDFSLEEIRQLDAGRWFGVEFEGLKIPTLKELCELIKPYSDLLLNVEIKERTYATVDLTMEILKDFNLIERCVFTCFDARIVSYIYDKYGLKTQGFPGFLMDNFEEGDNGTYSKMYAVGIDMKYLTKEIVQEFEVRGILPWSYCPDTDEQVEKSLEHGIRLVTVNNPKPAIKILANKQLRRPNLNDHLEEW